MRRSPDNVRLARGCAGCIGVVLAVWLTAPASAQTPAADPAAPLARYVPSEDLVIYAEFAGLDAHADAWKKTAASKMLNETPLGGMLEELGAQLIDQTVLKAPDRRLSGTDVVGLITYALHSGFAFAVNGKKEADAPASMVLVLRGAARKDVRAPVSKTLLSFGGTSGKAKLATKAGERPVAIMPSNSRPEAWAWWAEKEDVVIALDKPETADVVIEVLDGKRPSAVEHPTRVELAAADDGFVPVGLMFMDMANMPAPPEKAREQLAGIQRVDYRWGFEDTALMTVWRLVAPGPRQGALALFDGPKFDLASLPPMPEAVDGFTALSLDLPQTYDKLLALAKASSPEAGAKADEAINSLKTKYKIDVRKDVLPLLGPKIAFFVTPGKLAPTPAAGSEKPDAGAAGVPNPLSMLLSAVQVPKFALVVETKNSTAFVKKLDELMIAANKMLRESAKAAAAASKPRDEGDGEAASSRRGGGAAAPAAKFEMMAGKAKGYSLVFPSEMAKLPAGVKPTIRVGEKYIAIGINPAVASQALEAKESWKPAGDYASALKSVPGGLVSLNVSDPRSTLPQELASLPRTLQTTIAAAIQTASTSMAGMPGAAQGSAAGAKPGPGPGNPYPGGVPNSAPSLAPGTTGPTGTPSFVGAPGTAAPTAPGAVVFRIDPSKMPSAEALKPFLFPGYAALTASDKEIRFVTREAFPTIASGGASNSPASSMLLGPALQKAREAAMKQVAAQAKGAAATPTSPGEKPK